MSVVPFDVVGPISTVSKIAAIITVLTSICCAIVIVPYVVNRNLTREYPNMFIPFIGLSGFVLNFGFCIGMMYDYNPIRYPGATCIAQWVFLGPGGVTMLVLLFFYMFGLYEIVVLGRNRKAAAWRQKYVIAGTFIFSLIMEMAIPFGFPFATGEVFGPVGPWCAIRSLLVLTILFYTSCVPQAFAIVYMSIHVIYKVRKTTRAAESTIMVASASPVAGSQSPANNKQGTGRHAALNRFYARISVFAVFYATFTIAACLKRVQELLTTRWFDPATPNNPSMGISIVLPLLVCVQAIIFITTPAISKFWRVEVPGKLLGKSVYQTETGDTTDKRKTVGAVSDSGNKPALEESQESSFRQ